MPADVIDCDERNAQRKGECLGKGQPDQQRPQQSGAICDGDRIDLLFFNTCLADRSEDGLVHHVDMGAGSDLRDDPAVFSLFGRRGTHDIGQDGAAAQNGGSRFVARTLDPQNDRLGRTGARRGALGIRLHIDHS